MRRSGWLLLPGALVLLIGVALAVPFPWFTPTPDACSCSAAGPGGSACSCPPSTGTQFDLVSPVVMATGGTLVAAGFVLRRSPNLVD